MKPEVILEPPMPARRDLIRAAAAFIADAFLPRRAFAAGARPEGANRVIVVTFGGGVRWEDTFAPEGWPNIPHLVSDILPQGLFYPDARYEGLTGHFNATGALVTGCLQNVDAYGSEPPTVPTVFECFRKEHGLPAEEAWVVASNKSFGLLGGSKLRDWGDPCAANVILPKHFLVEAVKSAVSTDAGPGVEDRQALADRMVSALDEGYEGFGWRVHESGRALAKEVRQSLARSLLDYFNDPLVPTSGDELTFFMAKEIMSRLAPSLVLVNFWDIDIAHFGAYSLYLEAIRRTDRLVHGLWQHAQSRPPYRGRTTLIVVPEMGRDGDASGNGFANHRSGDESCRRLWLLAVGTGIPKGLVSERPIRTTDVAPTVARVLGFKMPEGEGRALSEIAF
jgi:hypothetical protein